MILTATPVDGGKSMTNFSGLFKTWKLETQRRLRRRKENNMPKTKTKAKADDLFEILKDNPKATIKWAKSEIKKYLKLIKLIEKKK